MPSIVHTNSALQARAGVALVSQSLSEEVTGLVSVSLEYVCAAAKSSAVDRLFYPDAPPPVWPSSIPRETLLARNLFLSARQVETSNGLARIRATYAGGILRGGNYVYETAERESPRATSWVSDTFSITRFDPFNPSNQVVSSELQDWYSYTIVPIVRSFRFIRIGGKTTGTFDAPPASTLYSLASYSSAYWQNNGWPIGLTTAKKPESFFHELILASAVQRDEKTEYAAPSVEVVTVRYYI